MAQIHIASHGTGWVQLAAKYILARARAHLDRRGRFTLALSGGSTPQPVYRALPSLFHEHNLSWGQVHLLWSDERCVPPDHPRSNYRMVRETLIDHIDIPRDNIHPMRCSKDPELAAVSYEATLRDLFPDSKWPAIDLVLLGLGTDGHTASLFPGSSALDEDKRWVVENQVVGIENARLTLTFPAINAAQDVAFLVAGADKAEIIYSIQAESSHEPQYPAQRIKPISGSLTWLLDTPAAARL